MAGSSTRFPRALLLGMVIMTAATVAAACSGESSPAAPADPVLAAGQKLYNSNCASCHGAAGGGGYGPKLAGVMVTAYPDIADQEAVIANGKGRMPAFENKLTPEQINSVTRYTREVLGAPSTP